ncbi:MAG: hypothetical protein KF813_05235 [Trueperaceae bacterium]|nr:hypothetical protein [Trueperaceae bacterium]
MPVLTAVPTAVFFTTDQTPCYMCQQTAKAIAIMRSRYPNVQFVHVLSPTSTDVDVIREWAAELPDPVITGLEALAYNDAFRNSMMPIIYLLNSDGEVMEAMVLLETAQLVALDESLDMLNSGRDRELLKGASRPLVLGERPERVPDWLDLDDQRDTFVYTFDNDCTGCRELIDPLYVQAAFNQLADSYPEVRFVLIDLLMSRAFAPDGPWLLHRIEVYNELAARLGSSIFDPYVRERLFEGDPDHPPRSVFPLPTLPDTGWHPSITVVRLVRLDEDDPLRLWGVRPLPNLLHFDALGRFQGPWPSWRPGIFRLSILVDEIRKRIESGQ